MALGAGLAGCEGVDFTDVRTDSQGNVREVTSERFVFQDNVRLLQPDSGVEVAEIDGDSLVLTGQVPPLAVGDVIVRGEGPSQFTRRVASVNQQSDRTVLTTERVGLNDIFKEADIQETIYLGPEFLSSLQPAIPGVSIGEPIMINAQNAQGTERTLPAVPLTFTGAVVAENGRGSVKIDGKIWLTVGVRTDLQVGFETFFVPTVNRFELVPIANLGGNTLEPLAALGGYLKVTGTGSGDFRTEIPLITPPLSYPIAGFAGIGLNMQGNLNMVVDGSIQADGTFAITEANVRMEAGVKYENGNWDKVQRLAPTFKIEAPALQGQANLNVSIAQPKISLNLCDMGEVFINAQVFKFEAQARAVTTPTPGYDIEVYRSSGLEVGARLAIGIAPIAVRYGPRYFPVLPPNRERILKFGVDLPRPDPDDVFTLVIPVVPEGGTADMKIGEERLYISLTAIRLGIAFVPFPLPVEWTSSNPSTLRLTGHGHFAIGKALRAGTADVKAVRRSGKTGVWSQSIASTGLTGLEIVPGLNVGVSGQVAGQQVLSQALPSGGVPEFGSREMRAIGRYANGETVDLTYAVDWTTGGDNARAFRNGQVDGRLQGTSQIRVTDPTTGRSTQTNIEVVRVPIEALTIYPITPSKIELTGGQTAQLKASARYSDGSIREVTRFIRWVSSDPYIAKVSEQGMVTTETPGQVTIKAIDPQGYAVASKTVIVNRAPLASLRLRPTSAGPFRVDQTQEFRATAVFADRTETSATPGLVWRTDDVNVARISELGVVTTLAPGRFKVLALMDGVSAVTPAFEVNGPAGFVYTAQPGDVRTGTPFSVTLEVRDIKNQIWTEPVQVTLELESGPANASLGGNLTATASNGTVTFDNLTINQVGQGYRLRAFSNGMSIALGEPFEGLNPSGPTGPVGHVFVNETAAANGVGGLTVLEISQNGTFTEATGSPYDTAGTAASMTKLGNFVVVAIGGTGANRNSLQSFEYDSADGSLTARDQTATNSISTSAPSALKLDSGGGDIVVSLSTSDQLLNAWRVAANGSLSLLDTEDLTGTGVGYVKYYDAPGPTDYIYLTSPTAREIRRITLDTTTGSMAPTGVIPYVSSAILTQPGTMGTLGNNLFVLNPTAYPAVGENDTMNWYTINDTNGALTAKPTIPGTGDGPVGIHAVGDLLFIGNQTSANILTYRVPASGNILQSLGFAPAGEMNPHSFTDVALSSDESGLYVATSDSIAAFILNTTTGILTALPGSPFGGFSSPGDIRN